MEGSEGEEGDREVPSPYRMGTCVRHEGWSLKAGSSLHGFMVKIPEFRKYPSSTAQEVSQARLNAALSLARSTMRGTAKMVSLLSSSISFPLGNSCRERETQVQDRYSSGEFVIKKY